SPGWVITETEIEVQAAEGHDQEWLAEAGRRLPLGRHQVPEDAAYAVLYLASGEAAQVTGEMLNLEGGFTVRELRERSSAGITLAFPPSERSRALSLNKKTAARFPKTPENRSCVSVADTPFLLCGSDLGRSRSFLSGLSGRIFPAPVGLDQGDQL